MHKMPKTVHGAALLTELELKSWWHSVHELECTCGFRSSMLLRSPSETAVSDPLTCPAGGDYVAGRSP